MVSKGSSIKRFFRRSRFIWLAVIDGLVIMAILSLGLLVATHVALGWGWVPLAAAVIVALSVHEVIEHWEELNAVNEFISEHGDQADSATTQAPHTPDKV